MHINHILDTYNRNIVISLKNVYLIDVDGINHLEILLNGIKKTRPDTRVLIVEPYSLVAAEILKRINWYKERQDKNLVF